MCKSPMHVLTEDCEHSIVQALYSGSENHVCIKTFLLGIAANFKLFPLKNFKLQVEISYK